jgi:hypothetical protein
MLTIEPDMLEMRGRIAEQFELPDASKARRDLRLVQNLWTHPLLSLRLIAPTTGSVELESKNRMEAARPPDYFRRF